MTELRAAIAEILKAHTWWLAGNLGVPGMPDWTTYRCNCGWAGDDPHAHVVEALLSVPGLAGCCCGGCVL